MLRMTSIVIAGAVGTSLLAAAAMQTEQHQDRQDRQQTAKEAEGETLEGRIVDLHHFLTLEETPDLNDPGIAGENVGGPVALLVQEERMIRGPRLAAYVLVAAPEGDDNPQAANAKYEQAQEKTGEMVRITGKKLENDDLKALEIRQIEEEAEDRERPEEDEDEDEDDREW